MELSDVLKTLLKHQGGDEKSVFPQKKTKNNNNIKCGQKTQNKKYKENTKKTKQIVWKLNKIN